jgi:hypothetical protein
MSIAFLVLLNLVAGILIWKAAAIHTRKSDRRRRREFHALQILSRL